MKNINLIRISEILAMAFALFFTYVRAPEDVGYSSGDIAGKYVEILTKNSILLAGLCILWFLFIKFRNKNTYSVSLIVTLLFLTMVLHAIRVFDSDQLFSSILSIVVAALFLCVGVQAENRFFYNDNAIGDSINVFFFLVLVSSAYAYYMGVGFFGYRFAGLSFHPNQFGLICSLATVNFFGNVLNNGKKTYVYAYNSVMLIFSLYYLLASGSRGGLMSAVIGVTYISLCYKVNLLKFFGLIFIVLVGIFLYEQYSENSGLIFERFYNNEDNRSEVFNNMLAGFFESPLYGVGVLSVGSENSYLKALSVGGVICGIPLILVGLACLASTANIMINAKYYFASNNSVKFAGFVSAIIFASMFDGYLFEKFGFSSILIMAIFSTEFQELKSVI